MVELSVIIQEHNEGKEFIDRMVSQVSDIGVDYETIFVTSMNANEFKEEYSPLNDKIQVIGNIKSTGAAINTGAMAAKSRSLLFVDCHVCFKNEDVMNLLNTLNKHPGAIIGPAIYPVDFPNCTPVGGTGYGASFYFDTYPFEWRWLSCIHSNQEYKVPFACGCAFMMRKSTFDELNNYGGLLSNLTGVLFDEEASMRLWRLGHPTYIEPRAQFGHLFIGSKNRPDTSTRTYKDSLLVKTIGAYINVFDEDLWDHIEKLCIKEWGKEIWDHHLNIARAEFSWLRNKMAPFKDRIDEDWFLRRSTA